MLKFFFYNNRIFRVPFLILRRILTLHFYSKKKYILSRTACLGNDSMNIAFKSVKIINNQKCRIDYINTILKNHDSIKFSFKLNNFIKRSDIYELYIQQVFTKWLSNISPYCIVFDSYSELTDQKFVSRAKTKNIIYSNYSDLSNGFENEFECEGLINVDELLKHYKDVFKIMSNKYPDVPIIFIHFPKKLENRIKFIQRHDDIKKVINLIKYEIKNFHVIDIPETIVNYNENDDFPYHFSKETYFYVSTLLVKILNKYTPA